MPRAHPIVFAQIAFPADGDIAAVTVGECRAAPGHSEVGVLEVGVFEVAVRARPTSHQLCIVPSSSRLTGSDAARYGYRAAASSSMSTPSPGSSDGCR